MRLKAAAAQMKLDLPSGVSFMVRREGTDVPAGLEVEVRAALENDVFGISEVGRERGAPRKKHDEKKHEKSKNAIPDAKKEV